LNFEHFKFDTTLKFQWQTT